MAASHKNAQASRPRSDVFIPIEAKRIYFPAETLAVAGFVGWVGWLCRPLS
jgi:hypothetical protein